MSTVARDVTPDEPRSLSAARRLKHDLGKYVRFSAPGTRETDVEALRERLRRDLLSTRETAEGSRGAVELFAEWRTEEGPHVAAPEVPELAALVRKIEEEMEVVARLVPRLDVLAETELTLLDEATRRISAACSELYRAAVSAATAARGAREI